MKNLLLISLVCVALAASAQVADTTLVNRYTAWHDQHPQLYPYLLVNQPRYVPGDTVFFKAWLMTADHRPLDGTFVMQMSLVNSAAQEIIHQSLRVAKGASGNQLVLPDTLKGGYYKLILYNNWMKFYGTENFHQQEIEVVVGQKIARKQPAERTVTFYPEGGRMIAGVPSKVVVMANTSGQGQLVDDTGKAITAVEIGDAQTGLFVFTPEAGRGYSLELNGEHFPLPQPATDGVGLLVTPSENRSSVRTVVSVPPGSRFTGATVQIMLTMYGRVHFAKDIQLSDKNFGMVVIPQTQLPPGVANIFVFSKDNELLASRMFIVTTPMQTRVTITPEKQKVSPREKIQLEIGITDESGLMVQGEMAVTAINEKLFESAGAPALTDDMLLDKVPFVRKVSIDRSKKNWYGLLDQQLVAAKSNDLMWLDPAFQNNNPSYMNTWLYARGRVFDVTNAALPDSTIIYLYLQRHPMAYEVRVKNGFVDAYFPMDFWGQDEFFYHAIAKGKDVPTLRLQWMNDTLTFMRSSAATVTTEPDPYATFRNQKSIVDRSYSFFRGKGPDVEELQVDLNAAIEDEIMGIDIEVKLDDYIAFNSMDEVIREIIPALIHRKAGNRSIVRVGLMSPNVPASGNPLYVIDGVMTMNTDFFMNLDPKNVHSIKVVNTQSKLKQMGALGRNGIVLVTSKKVEMDKVKAGSNMVSLMGLSKAVNFRNVRHPQTKAERMPDFRSTIFWDPSVKTDQNGKALVSFEASDDVGPVRISVAGVTADGRPFSGSVVVDVGMGQP